MIYVITSANSTGNSRSGYFSFNSAIPALIHTYYTHMYI